MEKIKKELKTFYIVSKCECGGEIDQLFNEWTYSTNPPLQDYKCNKCGKEYCLRESDRPHKEYEYV